MFNPTRDCSRLQPMHCHCIQQTFNPISFTYNDYKQDTARRRQRTDRGRMEARLHPNEDVAVAISISTIRSEFTFAHHGGSQAHQIGHSQTQPPNLTNPEVRHPLLCLTTPARLRQPIRLNPNFSIQPNSRKLRINLVRASSHPTHSRTRQSKTTRTRGKRLDW